MLPELVKVDYGTLKAPAMELEGTLYFNNVGVYSALGMSPEGLRSILHDHGGQLDPIRPLSVSNSNAKEVESFLQANQEVFGIKRLNKSIVWFSEDDFLGICFLATSDSAKAAQKDFKRYIKERRKISRYQKTELEVLKEQMAAITVAVSLLQERDRLNASSAGATLAGRKKIKTLFPQAVN